MTFITDCETAGCCENDMKQFHAKKLSRSKTNIDCFGLGRQAFWTTYKPDRDIPLLSSSHYSVEKKTLPSSCPYFYFFAFAPTAVEHLADTRHTYHVFGRPWRAAVAATRFLRTESYSKCLHTSSRATHLLFSPATSYI